MKMKKTLALIQIVIIMAILFIVSFSNISFAGIKTASELKNAFDTLRNTPGFREGDDFDEYGGGFAGAIQCHGWALKITNEIFGSCRNTNYDLWTDTAYPNINADDLCVGDIVRYNSDYGYDHSIVITNIVGDTIYYADCNWSGDNVIHWDKSMSKATLNDLLLDYCLEEGKQHLQGRIIHHKENDVKTLEGVYVPEGSIQDLGYDFVAQIVPKSNTNLAVVCLGDTDGSNIFIQNRDKSSNYQKWRFRKQSDGSYGITNMETGIGMDVFGSGNANGENVQGWMGGQGGDKQSWFIYSYNGGYRLVPRSSTDRNMSLDIDTSIEDGKNLQIYNAFNANNPNQTFLIEPNTYKPEGSKQDLGSIFIARIVPKTVTDIALTATGTENAAQVTVEELNENSDAQKWKFKRNNDGSYSIMNLNSNLYLDVHGSGNTNNEQVQLWRGGTGDKQSWFIYSYNGGYRLVPASSAEDLRALDIIGNVAAGGETQIYECVSKANSSQTFDIVKLNEYTLGDINQDGVINARDSKLALQHNAGKIQLTDEEKIIGDVNEDGNVDETDAKLILQYYVGKIENF